MFEFLKKHCLHRGGDVEEADLLLDKVKAYADKVEVVDDIAVLKNATVDAVAAHNSMKLDARENPDVELFEMLSPFSEYYLKKTSAFAFECANHRATSMELWMHISGFDEYKRTYDTFYSNIERGDCSLHIEKKMRIEDVEYEFSRELHEWQYFYMLVDWISEKLREKGFSVVPKTNWRSTAGEIPEGWDGEMTSITFIVGWADPELEEHISKLNDLSQADAYKAGVPIEDIVA